MLSYLTMLVLIMFFLHQVQQRPRDRLGRARLRLPRLGRVCSAPAIFALRGRLRKTETHYRHSHETDWIFLVMLLYVAVTGVAQHVLHRTGQAHAANILYLVHMMGVVPMLVLEVPFSKWAHLAYRPLAMYFSELQAEAITVRDREPRTATQAQVA